MPKQDLTNLEPKDFVQLKNALQQYNSWLVRQHNEITRRREYAFKRGNNSLEEKLTNQADVYIRTIARVKKLYETFQSPTPEEIAFNEWE